MTITLAINGACGRMGLTVGRLASESKQFRLVHAIESDRHPAQGQPYLHVPTVDVSRRLPGKVDVLVDFSTPEASLACLKDCVKRGTAAVVCTTGLPPGHEEEIARAAKKIACVYSSNMSVGVNLLFRILPEIDEALGPEYDVDIVETHHRGKKDAPSGTAKTLVGRLNRKPYVHSLRSGDEVGEHRVIFGGPGERIELIHRATTREVFARGALRAAEFASRAKPGLYTMLDVIAKQ